MEKEEEEEMRGQHGAPRKAEAEAAVTVGGGNTTRSHTQPSPEVTAVALHQWDWCRYIGEGPRDPSLGLAMYGGEEN